MMSEQSKTRAWKIAQALHQTLRDMNGSGIRALMLEYDDKDGRMRPYRAVKMALLAAMAESLGSAQAARDVYDIALDSGEGIDFALDSYEREGKL
jgi:hypothetical protein